MWQRIQIQHHLTADTPPPPVGIVHGQKEDAMKNVPKYIIRMLEKRRRLSAELMQVCFELDEYCRKIGVDFQDPDACLQTDVRIYCEFDGAYNSTLSVIEKTLNGQKRQR